MNTLLMRHRTALMLGGATAISARGSGSTDPGGNSNRRDSGSCTVTLSGAQTGSRANLPTANAFSCAHVGDESVAGTAATVYTPHTENEAVKADARIWVAKGSGLVLRVEEAIVNSETPGFTLGVQKDGKLGSGTFTASSPDVEMATTTGALPPSQSSPGASGTVTFHVVF